jgi:ABC-type multidrug transport system ATPase subunit
MDNLIGPAERGGLAVEHVWRRFRKFEVLKDASLALEEGQIGAVIGANGSGKTTLLRILAGVLTPDKGAVTVAGRPLGRARVGYVLAGDRGLYQRLTGYQNLEFFGRLGGLQRAPALAAARSVAAMLDATDLMEKRLSACSTGQRRRLAVARGFVARPPVVLIDEPFSDLDDTGKDAVATVMEHWAGAGGTVLFAAPSMEGGPRADVVFRMRSGELEVVS